MRYENALEAVRMSGEEALCKRMEAPKKIISESFRFFEVVRVVVRDAVFSGAA